MTHESIASKRMAGGCTLNAHRRCHESSAPRASIISSRISAADEPTLFHASGWRSTAGRIRRTANRHGCGPIYLASNCPAREGGTLTF